MSERVAATRLGLVTAIVVAVGLAGCGGGASSSSSASAGTTGRSSSTTPRSSTTERSSSTATTPRRPRRPPAQSVRGPGIGVTQSVHAFGSFLHVTVTGVAALPAGDASPPPGDRAVGVQLRIANESGQTYDSTASGDVSVIVSSGLSAPLDVRRGACETQLVDFESHLYSGDVRTGCVGFSVPRRATVIGVRFSPHARAHGSVTWRASG